MSRLINYSIKNVRNYSLNLTLRLIKFSFQLRKKFNEKTFCAKDLISELPRIATFNEKFNAFTTLTKDVTEQKLKESSSRFEAGKSLPLDGIFVAVKDNFCTKNVPATCASR